MLKGRWKKLKFEPLSEEHFKWAYAAYRKGAFADVEGFDDGQMDHMEPEDFTAKLSMVLMQAMDNGAEIIVATAPGEKGDMPMALVSINYSPREKGRQVALPHAIWFPWAKARTRLALGLRFMIDLKAKNSVIVTAQGDDVKYFKHLCRYGVLRPVGKLEDWYGEGRHGQLFQSKGD